jgi:group I intron endonuclease
VIGIYKITNLINQKVYIGQAINIRVRLNKHRTSPFNPKSNEYDSLIHQAIRKYGLDNFSFEVLEECKQEELNNREIFYIAQYKANNRDFGYNCTEGGQNARVPIKLSAELAKQITERLKTSTETNQKIADEFGVSERMVRSINYGECWPLDSETYPIRPKRPRVPKGCPPKPKKKQKTATCAMCGTAIWKGAALCRSCFNNLRTSVAKQQKQPKGTKTTRSKCNIGNRKVSNRPSPIELAKMIIDCGVQLKTGFVGTPYLLHVLSDYGYAELAYSLLLRKEYPSWLYPVTKGATTIWEHWDGIMEDGNFWRADMNSYNHYAYGSVMDWVYDTAAGIRPIEEAPGYAKVKIAPTPDKRLEWLNAELSTRHGRIVSSWKKEGNYWRYEITTPVEAEIVIAGKSLNVKAGTYHMYSII